MEDKVLRGNILQFTRKIKHASCGSFTLFEQLSRRIIPGFIYDVWLSAKISDEFMFGLGESRHGHRFFAVFFSN